MSFDFALILFIAVVISGLLALYDRIALEPKRKQAIANYKQQVEQVDEEALAALNKMPLPVEYGKSFFPILAIVFVLRSFLVEPFQIPSGSMIPSLEIGDFIVVNKFAYGVRLPIIDQQIIPIAKPKRGDVMVFKYPRDPSIHYIKRVIGLPGDTITYTRDKQLIINDQVVEQKFTGFLPGSFEGIATYEETVGDSTHTIHKVVFGNLQESQTWVVPDDQYFMMGDNRDNSADSRVWGFVPDKNIVGKAFAIWMTWPEPKYSSPPSFSRVGSIN